MEQEKQDKIDDENFNIDSEILPPAKKLKETKPKMSEKERKESDLQRKMAEIKLSAMEAEKNIDRS